jgi:hypothetical protein
VSCPDCGDREITAVEPSRAIRRKLVRVAQEGAPLLRIADAGSLAHPAAADLLAETGLLCFSRVEVAGEASALSKVLDQDLRRMSHLARFDVALYGADAASHDAHAGQPGAFDAALAGARRLATVANVPVGAYAVLHDGSALRTFARAWEEGSLPGEPFFRLARHGASLASLADAACGLGEGKAKDAIARVLPPCLMARSPEVHPAARSAPAFAEWPGGATAPSGSDRYGTYDACPLAAECMAAPRCPGLAAGWTADGIHALNEETGDVRRSSPPTALRPAAAGGPRTV